MSRGLVISIVALLFAGCGDVVQDAPRGTVKRAGKADGNFSCDGFCGGMAPGGCWCDAQCSDPENDDCCTDNKDVCDGIPGSCEGHCGGKSPDGCWCDAQCLTAGDCCDDHEQKCDGPAAKCHSSSDCEVAEYCHFVDGTCKLPTFNILEGECKTQPEYCYELYAPVCGCDGKTYSNDCKAHAAGTSIDHPGECAPPKCGPWPGGECAAGEVCDIDSCAPGASGVCVKAVSADDCATATTQPVCGCDENNYANDCLRLAAGVARKKIGTCAPSCWGAWLDEHGNCRSPSDGVMPEQCCAQELRDRCNKINEQYYIALLEAKKCYPWVTADQCTFQVANSLLNCSATCPTFVNSTSGLTKWIDSWDKTRCNRVLWYCPAVMCMPPSGASCLVNNGQAACDDIQGVP